MEIEGNVGIKVKHIGMLKKSCLKLNLFFQINLIKRNQKKKSKFFLIWKIDLGLGHKKFLFFWKKNVVVKLSKISMLKKIN